MELNSTFREKVERWKKNKDYLQFGVEVKIENQQIKYSIKDFDPKYKKALDDLAQDILKDAVPAISNAYKANIRKEDFPSEASRFRTEFNAKGAMYLQKLLDDGVDSFSSELEANSGLYKLQYDIAHAKVENGEIKKWDGEKLDYEKIKLFA